MAAALAAAAVTLVPRLTAGPSSTSNGPAATETRARPNPGLAAAQKAASLAALIADETSKLPIKPHSIISTTDKAMSAAEALRRTDYAAAATLAEDVLRGSTLQAFAFHPFNDFIGHLSAGQDPLYLDGLNAWVVNKPKSALAYLIRAKYFYDTAWAIRGPDFSKAVTETHRQGFQDFLGKAADDVRRSIELDPRIPWSYYLQLEVAHGRNDSALVEQAFQAGIQRFPNYYALYQDRLHYLQPKWSGSTTAMLQFVDHFAAKAPANSPLKFLYLQVTANLMNEAWVECQPLKHEKLTDCINIYMNRTVTGGLTAGVAKAFAVYKSVDPIQFNSALWPVLGTLVGTDGDSTSVNSLLQLAADAMGSDNQLIHDKAGNNNYVLDEIAARVWAKLDNPVNVEQKFHEALADVERTTFPNEEEKESALATIYDDMTWVARNARDYPKVIAYHDAANTIAGINHGGSQYLKCFAYYKLTHYAEAIEECTQLIATHLDVATAHYQRARAYEDSRNFDAAIADYAPIAEDGSENYIRDAAVINLEHIHALRGEYAAQLEIFSKYPFIFDASLQPPDDLAIAYNNRCFALMKTGELAKALQDCQTSLKYGKIPDALQKQQQLLKMLGKSS
jgi:tetratricopeptide (TPR) repeat protein